MADVKFIWNFADTANGAVAIRNLIGLIWLSRTVFHETKGYEAVTGPGTVG